jgi:hypothetical protein
MSKLPSIYKCPSTNIGIEKSYVFQITIYGHLSTTAFFVAPLELLGQWYSTTFFESPLYIVNYKIWEKYGLYFIT